MVKSKAKSKSKASKAPTEDEGPQGLPAKMKTKAEVMKYKLDRAYSRLDKPIDDHGLISDIVQNRRFFGLFSRSPRWPEKKKKSYIEWSKIAGPRIIFVVTFVAVLLRGLWMFLHLRYTTLGALVAPFAWSAVRSKTRDVQARRKRIKENSEDGKELDWKKDHEAYFSTGDPISQQRRFDTADEVLRSAQPDKAIEFNEYIREATSLAVYGCGILAATHVGGLRALERHGLVYTKIKTMAGVSAGSVVVACLAVGYDAEELFNLIEEMPFHRLATPELASVVRTLGCGLHGIVRALFGNTAAAFCEPLAVGNGPGINTGIVLEDLVAEAIVKKLGEERRDITLGEVMEKFGKRVIIIVTELDTGTERRLTPETDADLPLRVAVRMSMGVPGMMEPFEYTWKSENGTTETHVYCDGGMTNDFPMNALPSNSKRLGLMVRNTDWVMYNLAKSHLVDEDNALKAAFASFAGKVKNSIYPVKNVTSFISTIVQLMMDANLGLQVQLCLNDKEFKLENLLPEILTLCGGRLDPFNFAMSKDQHRDLYYAGQLCVLIHASRMRKQAGVTNEAELPLSDEMRLKATLLIAHLDPPQSS